MSLISKGVPPWLACLAVLILGLIIGLVNGILSFRLQGQALILTLGVGFFVKGGVQILVAMGTFSAGTGFFNFAVSRKITEFMILKYYFQNYRYVILSYYTIDKFNYL